MQEELNLKEWVVDARTGYLKNTVRKTAITPEQKETFLEGLKTLGNETQAAKLAGFSPKMVATHKRSDKKFREDYQATLVEMKNQLEGVMFIHALDPKGGYMDRITWLRNKFPKEYNPKFLEQTKDSKKAVDDLWQEIQKDKK